MRANLEPETAICTYSPEATAEAGRALAGRLRPGDVVGLYGDLGAGKTCFVTGLAAGLGCLHAVSSPTFTLVNEYPGPVPLYHFDLYRLDSPAELEDIGCDEYFYDQGVSVIEWAEKAGGLLPVDHWAVRLQITGERARNIIIQPPPRRQTQ